MSFNGGLGSGNSEKLFCGAGREGILDDRGK